MLELAEHRFTHTDGDLMRARVKLTPGQRLQARLDARAVMVGVPRRRLRAGYPELRERDSNLDVV